MVRAAKDSDLLQGVAQGDEAALRTLFERYAPLLLARLLRRCEDRTLAEDAVQETFVVVWQKAESHTGEGPVGAWLWGIARRQLVNQVRSARPNSTATTPTNMTVDDDTDTVITRLDAEARLKDLEAPLRAVVQMVVIDDLTEAEASRRLGIPVGTVKSRLFRARRKLREKR